VTDQRHRERSEWPRGGWREAANGLLRTGTCNAVDEVNDGIGVDLAVAMCVDCTSPRRREIAVWQSFEWRSPPTQSLMASTSSRQPAKILVTMGFERTFWSLVHLRRAQANDPSSFGSMAVH